MHTENGHSSEVKIEAWHRKRREPEQEASQGGERATVGNHCQPLVLRWFVNDKPPVPRVDTKGREFLQKRGADAGQKLQTAFAQLGLPGFLGMPVSGLAVDRLPAGGIGCAEVPVGHPLTEKRQLPGRLSRKNKRRRPDRAAVGRCPNFVDPNVCHGLSKFDCLAFAGVAQVSLCRVSRFRKSVACGLTMSDQQQFHGSRNPNRAETTCRCPRDSTKQPAGVIFSPGMVRPQSHTGRTAFSLLELLVVVAILIVLTGLSLAIAPSYLRSAAMSGALSQVASSVSLARGEAVRTRQITYFALAPVSAPLDARSFRSWCILRQDEFHGGRIEQITPWRSLPEGILFDPSSPGTTAQLSTNALPYPQPGAPLRELPVIAFLPDGSLDDVVHPPPARPTIALRFGTVGPQGPLYQGPYRMNQIAVARLSGKVEVERDE